MLAAEADGLAPQVTEKLVAAAGGNPLALREIPRGLSAEQRAGRDLALAPLRPGDTLERAFRPPGRRAARSRPAAALLVAACAETVRADVIAGALANAGLPPDALEPAEAAGLLTLRGREIEFDHPLVRAAVYHGGSPAERRDAHRALADAFPARSAEKAWHRAAAAPMPDAGVAQALMDAAGDARGRAAFAAAARGFARAGELLHRRRRARAGDARGGRRGHDRRRAAARVRARGGGRAGSRPTRCCRPTCARWPRAPRCASATRCAPARRSCARPSASRRSTPCAPARSCSSRRSPT